MKYDAYAAQLRRHGALAELTEFAHVEEQGRRFPLFRIVTPGARTLLITAGFHGEEPAGPLTLAEHLPEIITYARARGVGLRIYPCINPSGFEAHTRYNSSGERPNNDFLRYELTDGSWVGELMPDQQIRQWKVAEGGPKETVALRAELERHPAADAALDIHQDDHMKQAATYAYVFGDRSAFHPLIEACSHETLVAIHCAVDSNFRSDSHGLLTSHDGSVSDYCLRRGTRWVATLETTTAAKLEACHRVNLIWIRGFIEFAAQR